MDTAGSKEQQPDSELGSFHHHHPRSGRINAAGSRQQQPNRHGSYCEHHHRQHSGGRRLLGAFVDKKPSSFFRGEPQIVLANQSAYRVSYWVAEEDKTRTPAQRESIVTSIGLQLNAAVGNNRRAAAVSGLSGNSVRRPTEESVNTAGNNNNSSSTGATAIISRASEKASKQTAAETLNTDNNNNTSAAAVRSLKRGDQKPTEENLDMGGVGGGGVERTTPAETTTNNMESEVYFLTRDHRMGPAGQTQATKIAFPIDCRDLQVYAFFELDGLWRLYKDKVYSIGRFKKVFTLTSLDDNIKPHLG